MKNQLVSVFNKEISIAVLSLEGESKQSIKKKNITFKIQNNRHKHMKYPGDTDGFFLKSNRS